MKVSTTFTARMDTSLIMKWYQWIIVIVHMVAFYTVYVYTYIYVYTYYAIYLSHDDFRNYWLRSNRPCSPVFSQLQVVFTRNYFSHKIPQTHPVKTCRLQRPAAGRGDWSSSQCLSLGCWMMERYSQWLYLRTKAPFQVKINFEMDFEDFSKCLMVCFGILLLHYVLAQPQPRRGLLALRMAWPFRNCWCGFGDFICNMVGCHCHRCMLPMGCKMGNTCQGFIGCWFTLCNWPQAQLCFDAGSFAETGALIALRFTLKFVVVCSVHADWWHIHGIAPASLKDLLPSRWLRLPESASSSDATCRFPCWLQPCAVP